MRVRRLDHQPLAFFAHNSVFPGEFKLPRDADGLVAPVFEKFDVAFVIYVSHPVNSICHSICLQ